MEYLTEGKKGISLEELTFFHVNLHWESLDGQLITTDFLRTPFELQPRVQQEIFYS
jgi:hypothetical protein